MSSSIITASYDKQVRFWDPASGRTIRNLVFQDSQINALSVSFDRCRLAVAGYGIIRYYDIASSSQYPPAVAAFECSAAGNFTSIGHIPLTSGSGALLFACSEDGTLRLLDPRQSSMCVLRECTTGIAITCATVSPDYELLYTGSQIGKMSVWHCQSLVHDATHHGAGSSKPLQDISFPGDHSAIRSVAVAPLANWVAVATNAGKVHCLSKCVAGSGAAVGTSGGQRQQSATRSSAFPHPPMRTESCQGSLSEAAQGTTTTTNSENASLVSGTPGGDTPLNANHASDANSAVPPSDAASPIALSGTPIAPSMAPKPSLILSPLQQLHHLELVHTMICHHKYILKAAVSPDGKLLATCCADYTVGLWGVPQCLARPSEVSTGLATSPSAASPQKTVTSAEVASPQTPTDPGSPSPLAVTASALSPKLSMGSIALSPEVDSRAMGPTQSVLQPKAVHPYEFATLKPLQGHTRWVWDCAFSPCSTALVTVSSDNHVRLWSNILDKPKSDVFVGHTKPVVCVQLDVDRRRAADT